MYARTCKLRSSTRFVFCFPAATIGSYSDAWTCEPAGGSGPSPPIPTRETCCELTSRRRTLPSRGLSAPKLEEQFTHVFAMELPFPKAVIMS